MSGPTHLNVTCPSRDHLIDYLLGRLPDELVEPLEDHFADCDQCEDTLSGLSANDTFTQLAGSASSGQYGHDEDRAFVTRLVNQLQGDQRFHIQPRPVQERAAEVIRLLTPSESPASLGRLGNYRVERVLGAGSSGVVFYAIDESLDRPVALKVLRPSLGSLARQRFMIEARATASINSSQIVTIYQVGEENELAYIAMQWLPGETLDSRLQRVTFLPQAEVQTIAGQILQGLQAAHQKMLVHRDIKPANIWICEQDSEVKILDFGLARIADDDPQMTSTGILTGTPNFMSPEQARGQELSGRSDLFSLGCLMYQAATGILPFGQQRILATLQSIQHHHPRPPIELNPTLDNDFSDLVMCMLEKQPANRPASAEQAANALNQPRADWGFPAGRYPAGANDALSGDRAQDDSSTPIMPQHKSNAMRWVVACVLVGLGIWGWTVFGQQIIRIATNQGEIVIESNDENINVEILKNGELIRVVDLKSEQAIEIKAGEYEIKAGSNGKDNTITVEPNKLALNRGGKQFVVISKRESNLKSPTASETAATDKTLHGKTLKEWIRILKTELDPTTVQQACDAIGELAEHDQAMSEASVRSLIDWLEANQDFEVDESARPRRTETEDVTIAHAIDAINKISIENEQVRQRAFALVAEVLRDAPLAKTGFGTITQGNRLVQDIIGKIGCRFTAQHLKPEQAIEFIEKHLVNGTESSSFRLRQLPSEKVFAATIKQELPALIKSIEAWPEIAKSEFQRASVREFLRLGQYYFESEEFKEAAATVMEQLSTEEEK